MKNKHNSLYRKYFAEILINILPTINKRQKHNITSPIFIKSNVKKSNVYLPQELFR